MSDGLKQVDEIEDVLASISRLVAQSSKDQDNGALVLTAAQRIEPYVNATVGETVEGDFSAVRRVEIHREDAAGAGVESASEEGAQDTTAAETPPADTAPAVHAYADNADDDFAQDDALDSVGFASLDQHELRSLIVEIVREELRGQLGQKITRNVRKLVRQEIHHSLNARSMD